MQETQALREYFSREADVAAGRVRDVLAPHMLVYPIREAFEGTLVGANVVNERDGEACYFAIDSISRAHSDWWGHEQAANRFFAEQPKHEPWHDAQDGELWRIVTTIHNAYGVFVDNGHFVRTTPGGGTAAIPLDSKVILHGEHLFSHGPVTDD